MAETKKESSRHARQAAEEAGTPTTAEETVEAAAEATEENAAATGHKIERFAERQGESVKRGGSVAAAMSGQVAAGAAVGSEALARSGSAVAEGLQQLGRTWVELAQDQLRHGVHATETLLRCRTFGDVVQAQSEVVRVSLGTLLDKSARLSDISARLFAESAEPMAILAQRAARARDEPRLRG